MFKDNLQATSRALKAKKSEKAEAEKLKKDKEIEDAKWADDDKSAKKKQVNVAKSTNNLMSSSGLIELNLELSHIY